MVDERKKMKIADLIVLSGVVASIALLSVAVEASLPLAATTDEIGVLHNSARAIVEMAPRLEGQPDDVSLLVSAAEQISKISTKLYVGHVREAYWIQRKTNPRSGWSRAEKHNPDDGYRLAIDALEALEGFTNEPSAGLRVVSSSGVVIDYVDPTQTEVLVYDDSG